MSIQRYKIFDQMSDFFGEEMVKYNDHIAEVDEWIDVAMERSHKIGKLRAEKSKLQARIAELEASNKRKRNKIKSMESSDYDKQIKAEGIRDFKESFMQGLLSRQINADDFDEYADKLENKQ